MEVVSQARLVSRCPLLSPPIHLSRRRSSLPVHLWHVYFDRFIIIIIIKLYFRPQPIGTKYKCSIVIYMQKIMQKIVSHISIVITYTQVFQICDLSGRNQSHVGRVRFPLRAEMHGRAHITDSCFIAFI